MEQSVGAAPEEIFGLNKRAVLATDAPLVLDSGQRLGPITVAYETYGALNDDASNAILLCHALTGDQYAASDHPVTGKPGWWARFVGPGKFIDTDRYCVICPNVLGSCMGSTGPAEINPQTNQSFGLDFPVITIADMVRAQALLIDYLGIETLFSVIGGSMGGMQVLEWCALFPERVFSAAPIAATARHSAQNIAFHEVGRQAILADPNFHNGRYLDHDVKPEKGLSVARMAAHITYMSETGLTERFGRQLQDRDGVTFGFDADFQIESYLRHQGFSFVDRFDANAYLYITRAMDYFDIAARHDGNLAAAFQGLKARVCVLSFTSDWLYPTAESQHVVRALNATGARVSFMEIESADGHDAFLLDTPDMVRILDGFLTSAAQARGLGS
ncbi:MAG: homoserine O-acetyltransferase [Pseudomonadota bacterium]